MARPVLMTRLQPEDGFCIGGGAVGKIKYLLRMDVVLIVVLPLFPQSRGSEGRAALAVGFGEAACGHLSCRVAGWSQHWAESSVPVLAARSPQSQGSQGF